MSVLKRHWNKSTRAPLSKLIKRISYHGENQNRHFNTRFKCSTYFAESKNGKKHHQITNSIAGFELIFKLYLHDRVQKYVCVHFIAEKHSTPTKRGLCSSNIQAFWQNVSPEQNGTTLFCWHDCHQHQRQVTTISLNCVRLLCLNGYCDLYKTAVPHGCS